MGARGYHFKNGYFNALNDVPKAWRGKGLSQSVLSTSQERASYNVLRDWLLGDTALPRKPLIIQYLYPLMGRMKFENFSSIGGFKRFRKKLTQHSMFFGYPDQTKKTIILTCFIELDPKNLLDGLEYMLEVSTWGKKWHQTNIKVKDPKPMTSRVLEYPLRPLLGKTCTFFSLFPLLFSFCLCLLFPPISLTAPH